MSGAILNYRTLIVGEAIFRSGAWSFHAVCTSITNVVYGASVGILKSFRYYFPYKFGTRVSTGVSRCRHNAIICPYQMRVSI